MTILERCAACADYAKCTQMYGKFFMMRAYGWNPDWTPNDGNAHPINGCRHFKPKGERKGGETNG